MYAEAAAVLFLKSVPTGGSVLDVGAGETRAFADMCHDAGFEYASLDWRNGEDWETGSLVEHSGRYDGIWMSHVLEHMLDTHTALRRTRCVLKPDGLIAITVPPMKSVIVGGHVSLWNAGLLLYRLVMAGFDCREAAVKTYGYNCSVVVRRRDIEDMPPLHRDNGDIDRLAAYLPGNLGEGFDGDIRELQWRAV